MYAVQKQGGTWDKSIEQRGNARRRITSIPDAATQQLPAPLYSEFIMNAAAKFIADVEALTGCRYQDISGRTLTELNFNYPGKVLCRAGNLTLCEADQAYTDGLPTGNPADYVVVVNDLNDIEIKPKEDAERDPMMVEGNTSII